jgi:hypothetical protein
MPKPAPRPVLLKAANAGAHPAAPSPVVSPQEQQEPAHEHPAPSQEIVEGVAELVGLRTVKEDSTPAPRQDPAQAVIAEEPAPALNTPEPVVMFSVRIPQSLRLAVKVAAVTQETTIEDWVEAALRGALKS